MVAIWGKGSRAGRKSSGWEPGYEEVSEDGQPWGGGGCESTGMCEVWSICGRLLEMPRGHLLPTALTACLDATVLQSLISLQLLRVFGFGVPV